jgi:hypothetical protein
MSSKTIASGQLLADTDSWILASDHVIVLDVGTLPEFDVALEKRMVSAVGTLGVFSADSRIPRLSVDKIVSQERIRARAHQIFEGEQRGSAMDHWLRAERELLGA